MLTSSFFKPILFLTLIAACLFAFQCKRMHATDMQRGAWSLAALKNATYSGLTVHPRPVMLIDGRWEGAPYVEGGASRPSVYFVGDLYRVGTVAGSDADAAVVFLSESSGAAGTFLYLALVEKKNAALVNTATTLVGDRVQIRDVRLENDTIAVDVLQAGPQDAACCPGELATRQWELSANQLVESNAPARTGRLSLEVIAEATWELRTWDFEDPAPDEPTITLVYDNDRLAGNAGCNQYFAAVKAGDSPGSLQVGPSGTTRMMCPESIMTVEARFLKQFNGVKKFGFMAGQLALSFEMDGKRGMMCFDRQD